MPRPRLYEPDRVLDAVESLAVASGPAAVTIRGISAAVGVSNGALYHSFGSRSGLVGHAWLRAGRRFLTVQSSLVDTALSETSPPDPIAAVVAAADAPVVFAEQYPDSSKLLFTVHRDELLNSDVPDEIATELSDLDRMLVGLMIRLAVNLWDRKDARAVDAITTCIVDLPTAILLVRDRLDSAPAREHLRVAVRAILDIGPPPLRKGRNRGN
jgi:AcrR family transcriptional regulator